MPSSSSTSSRLGRRVHQPSLERKTPLDLKRILGSSTIPSEHHWLLHAGEQKGNIEVAILRFYAYFALFNASLASAEIAMEAQSIHYISAQEQALNLYREATKLDDSA